MVWRPQWKKELEEEADGPRVEGRSQGANPQGRVAGIEWPQERVLPGKGVKASGSEGGSQAPR